MPPTVPAPRPATLDSLTEITREISAGQAEVTRLSEDRKRIIRELDDSGTDYKDMAAAMGVTVATVYRIAPKTGRR